MRLLIKEPEWNHKAILEYPASILDECTAPESLTKNAPTILQKILKFEIWITAIRLESLSELSTPDKTGLESSIDRIGIVFGAMRDAINAKRI